MHACAHCHLGRSKVLMLGKALRLHSLPGRLLLPGWNRKRHPEPYVHAIAEKGTGYRSTRAQNSLTT